MACPRREIALVSDCGEHFDPQAPRDRRWIHLIKSQFAHRHSDYSRDQHRCRRARLLPNYGVGSARGLIDKSAVRAGISRDFYLARTIDPLDSQSDV